MAADDTQKIAQRYARALFALAEEAKALEAVEKDMASLKQAAATSEDFNRFVKNPLLPRQVKAKAMDAVLAKMKAHDVTRRFMKVLALGQRLPALVPVIAQYDALLTAHRGELVLEVKSAKALSAADEKALAASLGKAYGRKVRLQAEVDASLIGGLLVKAGGTTIDYSIKNKLARLARSLKSHAA